MSKGDANSTQLLAAAAAGAGAAATAAALFWWLQHRSSAAAAGSKAVAAASAGADAKAAPIAAAAGGAANKTRRVPPAAVVGGAFRPFAASAPGKIILSGEHAVVHGARAVAATVEKRSFAFFTPTVTAGDRPADLCFEMDNPQHNHELHFELSKLQALAAQVFGSAEAAWEHVSDADAPAVTAKAFTAAARLVDEHYPVPVAGQKGDVYWASVKVVLTAFIAIVRARVGTRILVQSELPMGAGLGSSASFAAVVAGGFYHLNAVLGTGPDAAARAAAGGAAGAGAADAKGADSSSACMPWGRFTGAAAVGPRLSTSALELINSWAYACECIVHGNPSGVDNTCVVHGGALVFSRKDGKVNINFLSQLDGLRVLVTNTRVGRSTKELVAGVGRLRLATVSATDSINSMDARSGRLISLIEQLQKGQIDAARLSAELGVMFPALQGELDGLGVGHAAIDSVVAAAKAHGFPASKLTGAGGGGSVITCVPAAASDQQIAGFVNAMIAAQRDCFEALIGQAGLLLHPAATEADIKVYP